MKTKIQWYVVTVKHVAGYTLTWKTRSEARANEMVLNAQLGGELVASSVTLTKPNGVK